jgi:hypothetical protein
MLNYTGIYAYFNGYIISYIEEKNIVLIIYIIL